MMPEVRLDTPEDIRCPHCKVVILKKERINVDADRLGAPEFCPRCGERTEPESSGGPVTPPTESK